MRNQDRTPRAVIRRLPHYLRALEDLRRKGISKISSGQLSEQIGYTASQIRQDLNHFGGFGQQGYGYNVDNLYQEIQRILGLDHSYRVVIVGCGRLGNAIAAFTAIYEEGFDIAGVFDSDPGKIGGDIEGHPVQDVAKLADFLAKEHVDVGIITVPADAAQSVADTLREGGIRGIWNFAPIDLQNLGDLPVENAHLSDGLRSLIYYVND